MTTRAQIIAGAFARLGIADYEFDVTPDERASARRKLNAMLALWEGEGIALSYVAGSQADNDAAEIATPAYADEAITDNLALRLAPDFGKTPSPELKITAKRGRDLCAAKTLTVPTADRAGVTIRGGGGWGYAARTL